MGRRHHRSEQGVAVACVAAPAGDTAADIAQRLLTLALREQQRIARCRRIGKRKLRHRCVHPPGHARLDVVVTAKCIGAGDQLRVARSQCRVPFDVCRHFLQAPGHRDLAQHARVRIAGRKVRVGRGGAAERHLFRTACRPAADRADIRVDYLGLARRGHIVAIGPQCIEAVAPLRRPFGPHLRQRRTLGGAHAPQPRRTPQRHRQQQHAGNAPQHPTQPLLHHAPQFRRSLQRPGRCDHSSPTMRACLPPPPSAAACNGCS